MPRAKGSASAIRKRSSHITVVVSDGKSAAKLVSSSKEEKVEAKGTGVEQARSGQGKGSSDKTGSVIERETVVTEAKNDKASKKKEAKEEAK
jgi:hypothetical protein